MWKVCRGHWTLVFCEVHRLSIQDKEVACGQFLSRCEIPNANIIMYYWIRVKNSVFLILRVVEVANHVAGNQDKSRKIKNNIISIQSNSHSCHDTDFAWFRNCIDRKQEIPGLMQLQVAFLVAHGSKNELLSQFPFAFDM